MAPVSVVAAVLLTQPTVTPDAVRVAVERSLPLLRKAAAGHADQQTCFGCHNQAFPMVAFAAAKGRGFDVPTADTGALLDHLTEFLIENRDRFESGKGTGGGVDTAGWALLTLEKGERKPDEITAAVAKYLLSAQAERDHWRCSSDRPPSEASHFGTTFLAVRGLNAWATEEQKEAAGKRIAAAKGWLEKTTAKDTEDRVFRLLALYEAGAEAKAVRAAADDLLGTQRADGGWGQTDKLDADAYATGTALFALHETKVLATDTAVYRAGLAFLLRTQLTDGSWLVRTRSKPFQKYYESGFPHEKDQFISVSASGWATAALAFALRK